MNNQQPQTVPPFPADQTWLFLASAVPLCTDNSPHFSEFSFISWLSKGMQFWKLWNGKNNVIWEYWKELFEHFGRVWSDPFGCCHFECAFPIAESTPIAVAPPDQKYREDFSIDSMQKITLLKIMCSCRTLDCIMSLFPQWGNKN